MERYSLVCFYCSLHISSNIDGWWYFVLAHCLLRLPSAVYTECVWLIRYAMRIWTYQFASNAESVCRCWWVECDEASRPGVYSRLFGYCCWWMHISRDHYNHLYQCTQSYSNATWNWVCTGFQWTKTTESENLARKLAFNRFRATTCSSTNLILVHRVDDVYMEFIFTTSSDR